MVKFPDFIIAGFGKCATTSLRYILSEHPDIFIPDREVHYFNHDNYTYLYQHESPFKGSTAGQIIGESSGYLSSERTLKTISETIPNVKIIVMLRDPTSRAYSIYWHRVRTGRRVNYSFEKSLLTIPNRLLESNLYKKQIERLLKFIPRDNICFILFEDLIKDVPATINQALSFIGASLGKINFEKIDTYYNPALIPRYPILKILRNRLFGPRRIRGFDRLFYMLHPFLSIKPPPINPITRMFLNAYFAQENKGLDKLIGKDLKSCWYK